MLIEKFAIEIHYTNKVQTVFTKRRDLFEKNDLELKIDVWSAKALRTME